MKASIGSARRDAPTDRPVPLQGCPIILKAFACVCGKRAGGNWQQSPVCYVV